MLKGLSKQNLKLKKNVNIQTSNIINPLVEVSPYFIKEGKKRKIQRVFNSLYKQSLNLNIDNDSNFNSNDLNNNLKIYPLFNFIFNKNLYRNKLQQKLLLKAPYRIKRNKRKKRKRILKSSFLKDFKFKSQYGFGFNFKRNNNNNFKIDFTQVKKMIVKPLSNKNSLKIGNDWIKNFLKNFLEKKNSKLDKLFIPVSTFFLRKKSWFLKEIFLPQKFFLKQVSTLTKRFFLKKSKRFFSTFSKKTKLYKNFLIQKKFFIYSMNLNQNLYFKKKFFQRFNFFAFYNIWLKNYKKVKLNKYKWKFNFRKNLTFDVSSENFSKFISNQIKQSLYKKSLYKWNVNISSLVNNKNFYQNQKYLKFFNIIKYKFLIQLIYIKYKFKEFTKLKSIFKNWSRLQFFLLRKRFFINNFKGNDKLIFYSNPYFQYLSKKFLIMRFFNIVNYSKKKTTQNILSIDNFSNFNNIYLISKLLKIYQKVGINFNWEADNNSIESLYNYNSENQSFLKKDWILSNFNEKADIILANNKYLNFWKTLETSKKSLLFTSNLNDLSSSLYLNKFSNKNLFSLNQNKIFTDLQFYHFFGYYGLLLQSKKFILNRRFIPFMYKILHLMFKKSLINSNEFSLDFKKREFRFIKLKDQEYLLNKIIDKRVKNLDKSWLNQKWNNFYYFFIRNQFKNLKYKLFHFLKKKGFWFYLNNKLDNKNNSISEFKRLYIFNKILKRLIKYIYLFKKNKLNIKQKFSFKTIKKFSFNKKNTINLNNNKKNFTLILTSNNSKNLNFYKNILTKLFKKNGIKILNIFDLHKDLKFTTVVNSPHVYKKSQSKYVMKTYKVVFICDNFIKLDNFDYFLKTLTKNLPPSINLRFYF